MFFAATARTIAQCRNESIKCKMVTLGARAPLIAVNSTVQKGLSITLRQALWVTHFPKG
jgi:hypothetical protein